MTVRVCVRVMRPGMTPRVGIVVDIVRPPATLGRWCHRSAMANASVTRQRPYVLGRIRTIRMPNAAKPGPGAEDTTGLLQSCAAGDRAAFRALYDRWAPRLNGIALRIT